MDPVRGTEASAPRTAAAVLVAALLVGALVAGATAAVATAPTTTAGTGAADGSAASGVTATAETTATEGSALAQDIDPDRTRIRIALQPDGDGRWTVELWTRLADDADEEAFASLQADVRNDSEAFTTDFRERMNGSVTAASDATGREMTIENVTVSTRTEGVPSSYGVLAYHFEWTNFAAVDGDRIRAGDAIDGFLLEENTRLTIGWPEAYRLVDAEPAPDDETDAAVVWQGGETDFVTGQPRVVVTSAPAEDDTLLPVIAVAVAILALLLALAWLVRSGRLELPAALGESGTTDGGEPAASGGAAAGGEAVNAPAGAGGAPAAAERDDGATDDAGQPDDPGDGPAAGVGTDTGGGGDAEDDGSDTGDDVPPELLSNEEQVLRLLEDHGGRMKQQQVVSELDWTEAKTSQVVTGMREEEQIEVFRIGRENVLALPEEADL